jgi:hypothetical protein
MSHVFLYQVVEPSGLVPPKVVIQALAAQLDENKYQWHIAVGGVGGAVAKRALEGAEEGELHEH